MKCLFNSRILVASILLLILSCDKTDEGTPVSPTDISSVTGIDLLPESGPSPYRLGNPNIYIDKNVLSIRPNPVVGVLNVESREVITDVWLVRAQPEKIYQDLDFTSVLNSNTYTETEIGNASVLKVGGNGHNVVYLDFENLEKGYYRIFIKTNGEIMWDNVLYTDNDNIQEIVDYWK